MFIISNPPNLRNKKDFDFFKNNPQILYNEKTSFIKNVINKDDKEQYIGRVLSDINPNLYYVDENNFNNSTNIKQYNFINEKKKVFISVHHSIHHFLLETLAPVMLLNKYEKDLFFVIDDAYTEQNIYHQLLKDFLIKNNIDHIFLKNHFVIAINNYYNIITLNASNEECDIVSDFILQYVDDINKKPFRKVYVSRRRTSVRSLWGKGINDRRIHNEYLLEEHLLKLGFEIVNNENFKSIKDQINFFYEASIIFSATSSGLANALFMQPEQTMIELITPMIVPYENIFRLHSHLYLWLSYTKKHLYFGIPSDFSSFKIIDFLEKHNLKNIITNNKLDK